MFGEEELKKSPLEAMGRQSVIDILETNAHDALAVYRDAARPESDVLAKFSCLVYCLTPYRLTVKTMVVLVLLDVRILPMHRILIHVRLWLRWKR